MEQSHSDFDASMLSITQATTATFNDLYFRHTFLFFIQRGDKHVACPVNGELLGRETDLLVFPAGSIVMMENRPVLDADYHAQGVCFSHDLVALVFSDQRANHGKIGVQRLVEDDGRLDDLQRMILNTLHDPELPAEIRRHRLVEVLLWLKRFGIRISPEEDRSPIGRVRRLIETDLSHPWRAKDVADHFAMSEATMRRWLTGAGQSFSKIL